MSLKHFQIIKKIIFLFTGFGLISCSYLNTDKISRVLATDYYEIDNVPENASLYTCEKNKFYLRKITTKDNKEAFWIFFDAKEYLFNKEDDVSYENPRYQLKIKEGVIDIVEKSSKEDKEQYLNCKIAN